MSCICQQPVRPGFKDSYKDLLDKPQINGVPLNGDVNTDDLHINYPHLANLPKINGVTLDGNLTPADLGIRAGAQFKVVPKLPVTDIDEATIYLVPVQVGQTDNIYQEWFYINNKWEKIGEPINIQGTESRVTTTKMVIVLDDDSEDYFSFDSSFDFRQKIDKEIRGNTIYICRPIMDYSDSGEDAPVLIVENGASFPVTLAFTSSENYGKYEFEFAPYRNYALKGDITVWDGSVYINGDFIEVL